MDSIYYVYVYLDSRKPGIYYYHGLDYTFKYEPFYVGKGKGLRMHDHIKECIDEKRSYNNFKTSKIKNIKII